VLFILLFIVIFVIAELLQNKKKLITYVIASGVMYGEGENIMRYLFNVRCPYWSAAFCLSLITLSMIYVLSLCQWVWS